MLRIVLLMIAMLLSTVCHSATITNTASQHVAKCKKSASCKILAEAIVYEARGESDLGKAALAHLILTRVNKSPAGTTVYKVVTKPGAFQYRVNRYTQERPTIDDWNKAYEVANRVMAGEIRSPIADATFVLSKSAPRYIKRSWDRRLQYVTTIGNHMYYKPKRGTTEDYASGGVTDFSDSLMVAGK